MYSVVIVDDEQYDLEGLVQFIPWSELNMNIVGGFCDAFSAFEYIKDNKIDILVTDINMPIMSGLELAEKAIQLYPKLKLVFVTGHEDFQFAKRALAMQASSYVLKPVDDDELIDVLYKVGEELKQLEQESKQLQTMKNSMSFVKHELLRRCLLGTYDESIVVSLREQCNVFSRDEYLHVAVIEVDDTRWKLQQYSEQEQKELLEKAYRMFALLCAQHGIELYIQLTLHRFVLLMSESQEEMLIAWINNIEERLNFTITIGIGLGVKQIEELQISFNQAIRALSYKMVHGKRTIIRYAQQRTVATEPSISFDLEATLKVLYEAITTYDLVGIVDCVDELFTHATSLNDEASIYQFVLYCVSKIEGFLYDKNENLYEVLQIDRSQWSIIMQFETIEDIHSWFRRTLFKLSECMYEKKNTQPSRLMQDIQYYISNNLEGNITLKAVAQHFSFSPNYLGHMFKLEMGTSFNDYVTKLKMARAKDLLQDPTIKVYEVASAIGYKDLTYFSKQFKEFTGITAGDYRKRC